MVKSVSYRYPLDTIRKKNAYKVILRTRALTMLATEMPVAKPLPKASVWKMQISEEHAHDQHVYCARVHTTQLTIRILMSIN